jgi:hypothetical protein
MPLELKLNTDGLTREILVPIIWPFVGKSMSAPGATVDELSDGIKA